MWDDWENFDFEVERLLWIFGVAIVGIIAAICIVAEFLES